MAKTLTIQLNNIPASDTSLSNSQKRKKLYINFVILDFFYNENDKQQNGLYLLFIYHSGLIILTMQFNKIFNSDVCWKKGQI